MALPVLDAGEQRVLGCLLEKQVTVPASYPLTLNALRTACNQSSSREPVVDWDEPSVEAIARRLRQRELVRVVWADTGRRVLKYHQLLSDALELGPDERALTTVLLLRGPQAAGELRVRTERLHSFADRSAVEACLAGLAARVEPLVAELPRRPGERDPRWVHLLGDAPTEAPAATIDIDVQHRDAEVITTYDAVARDYAAALAQELEGLPFERWLLAEVARQADGPVIEVGCGPGHVTAYLTAQGADAHGLDLSPAMVAEARQRFPEGSYQVGDLRQLMRPTDAPGWAAVLAWYSLIHLAPAELPDAVAALVRPLAPSGQLVLATQTGGGTRRVTEWFGHDVGLTFVRPDRETVLDAVRAAGLTDLVWYHRGPLASREETTERLYVLARRPA
ncbi:MAG: DUF480 domain-containing protein [Mycobacteriales bacterium]